MRTENTYLWRISWNGGKRTTRHHCTEEHIRREHPDAVMIPGSLVVVELPETPDEHSARWRAGDTTHKGPKFGTAIGAPYLPDEKRKGP